VGKSIINLSSVTTVGLDPAKHVFQVYSVDASGCVVVAKAGDVQESGLIAKPVAIVCAVQRGGLVMATDQRTPSGPADSILRAKGRRQDHIRAVPLPEKSP
jgi:20S proteasome alpha/beta subunit